MSVLRIVVRLLVLGVVLSFPVSQVSAACPDYDYLVSNYNQWLQLQSLICSQPADDPGELGVRPSGMSCAQVKRVVDRYREVISRCSSPPAAPSSKCNCESYFTNETNGSATRGYDAIDQLYRQNSARFNSGKLKGFVFRVYAPSSKCPCSYEKKSQLRKVALQDIVLTIAELRINRYKFDVLRVY